MNKWFRTGTPWIWLTAASVGLSLIAVVGLCLMIFGKGLAHFWPSNVEQYQITENGQRKVIIGEHFSSEMVPKQRLITAGAEVPADAPEQIERLLIKTGNREFVDLDFRWLLETQIMVREEPDGIAVLERVSNGNFYGVIEQVKFQGQVMDLPLAEAIEQSLDTSLEYRDQAKALQNGPINQINYQLEQLRLKARKYELKHQLSAEIKQQLADERAQLMARYEVLEKDLFALLEKSRQYQWLIRDMRDDLVPIAVDQVVQVHWPNRMNVFEKTVHWLVQMGRFIVDDPREANTEGGVFPAIFGTVFMVILMAIVVMPLGVIAAIYLHEYAPKNTLTSLIRISVINLAGVPSIVYGVFGLGFFVYFAGGSIDQLFYPEALPSPTFGSPGVMWSALTLAILTLPVVIVSTEEGLARIPPSIRQGSLALGATKVQTLLRIVIPMASPAIMTGLILAVARAAGEVAPLMLVGVVKLAPSLPIDMNFPFVHLERKFMHLGFHIYDVGFQSPNVEAARPLVFASASLLVLVIISLNLAAISIRNRLREKFKQLDG